MPRSSITRRLIRRLSFPDVKAINNYFQLPPRKSKEAMVGQIVYQVGTGIELLVSAEGPFSLGRWNEIVEEIGGSARNSFAAVGKEIAVSLDPVYDELDGDTSILELRNSRAERRILATKLGIGNVELAEILSTTHGGTHLSTFVTEFRRMASMRVVAAPPRQHGISVASTRVSSASVERMSLSWMAKQVEDAEVLEIAAGFYDSVFLENVLKRCRAHTVRLIFNGLGGRRLHAQRGELIELVKKLGETRHRLDVRLSFAPGMFHSKLYLITKNGKTRALLGSANATSAAFSRNEEILVSLDDAGSLTGYFESAWGSARTLDSLVEPANSLISFFRTGVLYFKPTASLATTINPFRDLLNSMTNDERALLGGVELPFSDQVTGIGPFNLRQAIRGMAAKDDWEEADINHEAESTESRLSIKPWAVETCFGYWVPSRLDSQWQMRLATAGAAKRKKFESFRSELNEIDKEALIGKYQLYLDEVKRVMLEKIERLPVLLQSSESNPFDPSIFEKFFARIVAYLDEDSRVKRLAEPFISGAIPELWDDEEAYLDFRSSFFEYLDQVARLRGSKTNAKVARIILKKLGVVEPVGSEEEWSSLFEEFLEENGWTEDDWTQSSENESM